MCFASLFVINIIQYYVQDIDSIELSKDNASLEEEFPASRLLSSTTTSTAFVDWYRHLAEVDLDQTQINHPLDGFPNQSLALTVMTLCI